MFYCSMAYSVMNLLYTSLIALVCQSLLFNMIVFVSKVINFIKRQLRENRKLRETREKE